MRALRALIVVLMAAQVVLVAAAPASAQVTDTVPCPAGIPDAGFADIDPSNIHKHDIDCIAFWEITTQVGTYDALGLVTRAGQNLPGTLCTGSGVWPAGRTFRIVEGYVLELPGDPASLTSTSFSLTVGGSPVLLREKHIILEGLHFRVWEASFPGGLTGNHTITGQWFSGGPSKRLSPSRWSSSPERHDGVRSV